MAAPPFPAVPALRAPRVLPAAAFFAPDFRDRRAAGAFFAAPALFPPAAFLPAAVTAPFLIAERARADAGRGRALPVEADYRRILDEIRRTRLSRVEGTLLPGLNAMAAPVFDYRGKLSSVIGLVGHRDSLDMQPQGPIAKMLQATAADLSARLGFVEPRAGGTG